jgi:hypothetical protein
VNVSPFPGLKAGVTLNKKPLLFIQRFFFLAAPPGFPDFAALIGINFSPCKSGLKRKNPCFSYRGFSF